MIGTPGVRFGLYARQSGRLTGHGKLMNAKGAYRKPSVSKKILKNLLKLDGGENFRRWTLVIPVPRKMAQAKACATREKTSVH
jgi:hypothetical protein